MATQQQREEISKAGLEAIDSYSKNPTNKPAYTSRAWTGTFILPIVGTLIGLCIKSEGVESFERGKDAAKKEAEYIKAKELGIKGEELAKYGKDFKYSKVLDERTKPNERVFWGAVVGLFTLGPIVPLAATVFNMASRSYARGQARKESDRLYTEIVKESKGQAISSA